MKRGINIIVTLLLCGLVLYGVCALYALSLDVTRWSDDVRALYISWFGFCWMLTALTGGIDFYKE